MWSNPKGLYLVGGNEGGNKIEYFIYVGQTDAE
jgi:hypothetical protein